MLPIFDLIPGGRRGKDHPGSELRSKLIRMGVNSLQIKMYRIRHKQAQKVVDF